ncbi:MAG: DUF362 domain-containing protein [Clostridia bacterium]|nr:DUF362 domain-containing protein [Clostridia bacterium]
MSDTLLSNIPVAYASCREYDVPLIRRQITALFHTLNIGQNVFCGKVILVKPNLVMAKKPELAATTHPAVLQALAEVLAEFAPKKIIIADSAGGPYNLPALQVLYRTCGLSPLDKLPLVELNTDCGFSDVEMEDGQRLRHCHMINPAVQADVCINVCKLKTHGLTGLSCATKNLFGLIPGVEKFEMHATFPQIEDFSEMLVDISEYMRTHTEYIALCDGIMGMEGNGPTHGTPVSSGLLLASRSPYALDVVAEHIIGCENAAIHLDAAAARGLVSRNWQDIPLLFCEDTAEMASYSFRKPASSSGKFLKNLSGIMGGRLAEAFAARPAIRASGCVGCGVCVQSCPVHTISLEKKKQKKIAVIHPEKCIRCYCCQELCPKGAVVLRKNPLIRWIH